jgi:16S rRNA A1518/A1519 N6-dimethyltransferase RsmA/KsgA/DIM1 with predicted DNA glycosylase/AP lyase activity
MIHAGFAHKRKFLKNNLMEILSKEKIEKIWQDLNKIIED